MCWPNSPSVFPSTVSQRMDLFSEFRSTTTDHLHQQVLQFFWFMVTVFSIHQFCIHHDLLISFIIQFTSLEISNIFSSIPNPTLFQCNDSFVHPSSKICIQRRNVYIVINMTRLLDKFQTNFCAGWVGRRWCIRSFLLKIVLSQIVHYFLFVLNFP